MKLVRAIIGKHGADEFIKAMAQRMKLRIMPEMPFTEQRGAVAALLE